MIRLAICILSAIILLFICFMILLPPGGGKVPASKNPRSLSERTSLEVDGARLGLILLSEDTTILFFWFAAAGLEFPSIFWNLFIRLRFLKNLQSAISITGAQELLSIKIL